MRNAAIAVFAALLLVTGCSGPESVQEARKQVDLFHKQYDNGQYEAIWKGASSDIQGTMPKEEFAKMLEGIHSFHGKVRETKQTGWYVKADQTGSFSELVMQPTFERGTAYEDFIFRNQGPHQKLAGYHIGKDPPSSKNEE